MNDSHILIAYNEPVLPPGHPDAESERDIVGTVDTVRQTLADAGYPVRTFAIGRDLRPLLDHLHLERPDAVFNLFEGLADQTHTEITVAGLFEWLELPFTGSPLSAIALARDKVRTKHLLRGAGLTTAEFFMVENLPCPVSTLGWPVIVKPATQDASVGIEQASVVTSQRALAKRVKHVLERYGPPVLIERYVHGRELFVSLIQDPDQPKLPPEVLPLAEIAFLDNSPKYWPIYSYDAKWAEDSHEFRVTPLRCPVEMEPAALERIQIAAREAFRVIGLRDYARLDIRLTAEGVPYILEVNPNPFLNSLALINGLEALGRRHTDFLLGLVRAALARGPALAGVGVAGAAANEH